MIGVKIYTRNFVTIWVIVLHNTTYVNTYVS